MNRPRPRLATLSIVVPAKNEAQAIEGTLASLPVSTLRLLGLASEIVVLDGNSQDATAELARAWGARVLKDRDPGKALALRRARRQLGGDLVVMLDGDGTYAPDAIPRLLAPLLRGEADAAMGVRVPQPGAMPRSHRFGNAVLSAGASILYWRECRDLCTGLWGFRREALLRMPLRSRGFGLEAELFAMACRRRLRLAAVEVDYLPRQGVTNLHGARDGWRIARRLVRSRFARLPRAPVPAAAAEAVPAATTAGAEVTQ